MRIRRGRLSLTGYRLILKATPVLPADQVITYVLKDLHEADSLLEVSDSKSFEIPNTYDKDYNAFRVHASYG